MRCVRNEVRKGLLLVVLGSALGWLCLRRRVGVKWMLSPHPVVASSNAKYGPLVDCEFSEFSYGYAAIREAEADLSAVYRAAGAPVLPSLLQEEHLGWDVSLRYVEYALFLQFKRPQFVSRRHPASPTWPQVGVPHYRVAIDTDGHQHAALAALQHSLSVGGEHGNVYYAAPVFHTQFDFDQSYGLGRVLEQSTLVEPSDLGVMDGTHHLVSVGAGPPLILSEPRRPERPISWESLTTDARDRAARWRERDLDSRFTVGGLEEALRGSVSSLKRTIPHDLEAPITSRLQRSAAALGCGLVLLLLDDEDGNR